MKLKFLGGGQASRAEVYGLFLASIVLVGGGIGGAFAITNSLNQNQSQNISAISESATPTITSTGSAEVPTSSPSELATETRSGGDSSSPVEYVPKSHPPVEQAPFVDTRIQEPYIGPADTFSYLSRNYICGWDTEALGGFGWGFDPAEPCTDEFVAYVGQHCEANDGVVYAGRCEQYFSHSLPVAY
ncbi:hypothetical protein M2113_000003 [Aurantimicrobium minutum]|uniref:hypothetical protein n=1 Tax=Aurantimicrobium minutum TaxID=708131 RepID=UPI002473DEED|nr:hypothetical protein [Aurantimicrobium minutum]MDH6409054.1 hypothetical protein [Aurantimicrobium minutum]